MAAKKAKKKKAAKKKAMAKPMAKAMAKPVRKTTPKPAKKKATKNVPRTQPAAGPTRYTFDTIDQVEHFSVPPEVIYRVWLDPVQHAAFTGSPATGEARVGAEFTAWDGYIRGETIELVDNERIVQRWRATDFPPGYPDSRLEITLTPQSGGTHLRLHHSAVPKKNADSYAEGWHEHYWRPLRAYLAERT
jgi:uncharacterized protein YndB with AHSA1/START domain